LAVQVFNLVHAFTPENGVPSEWEEDEPESPYCLREAAPSINAVLALTDNDIRWVWLTAALQWHQMLLSMLT
jgi:hypothetical protein